MPVDIEIIRACEFVRFGTQGEFDFESTRAVLLKLIDACGKRNIERALLDIREASSRLTRDDLMALVNVFGESVVSKRLRVAILHTSRQTHRAKLFAFLNVISGRHVRAFETFEKGLVWLSKARGEEDSEAAAGGQPVPIRVRTHGKKNPAGEEPSNQ